VFVFFTEVVDKKVLKLHESVIPTSATISGAEEISTNESGLRIE